MKTGIEAVNSVLSSLELEECPSHYKISQTRSYVYKASPTIAGSTGACFVLSDVSKIIEVEVLHEYVDRFNLPLNCDETLVKRAADFMVDHASKVCKKFKGQKLDLSFQMPGNENMYRICERTGLLEIRLYMQIFKEI